jgi:hypothetical protein
MSQEACVTCDGCWLDDPLPTEPLDPPLKKSLLFWSLFCDELEELSEDCEPLLDDCAVTPTTLLAASAANPPNSATEATSTPFFRPPTIRSACALDNLFGVLAALGRPAAGCGV